MSQDLRWITSLEDSSSISQHELVVTLASDSLATIIVHVTLDESAISNARFVI